MKAIDCLILISFGVLLITFIRGILKKNQISRLVKEISTTKKEIEFVQLQGQLDELTRKVEYIIQDDANRTQNLQSLQKTLEAILKIVDEDKGGGQ